MKEGQWYPGSMAKAINHLRHDLKIVDLVVELLDSRVPISSRNPVFAGLLDGKRHLILLHKADRAEEAVTERWLSFFKKSGITSMAFSVHHNNYLVKLLQYLKDQENNLRSGRIKRPLRMMIVGIPNVGKSTMINHFVRKAVARTGNQPGVTKGRQWIRITPGLELLDTPGVLWPSVNEETTWPLAVVGAIPTGRVDLERIALWLINYYLKKGIERHLIKRYQGLTRDSSDKMLNQVALSQGCLLSAGKVDLERAAVLILRDFQAGLLGRITLEEPPE